MPMKAQLKTAMVVLSPIISIAYFVIVFIAHFTATNFGGVDAAYLQNLNNANEYLWRNLWALSSMALVLVVTLSILEQFKF